MNYVNNVKYSILLAYWYVAVYKIYG